MTQTNSQIREEFNKKYKLDISYQREDEIANIIADWWLSKIDELLKSQREEMIEKIEKMIKIVNYQLGGFFIEEESYNEAIKDILSPIKNNG